MEFKSDFLSAVEFIEALRYFSRKGLLTFLFNPLVPTSGGLWGATFPYQAKLFLQSGTRLAMHGNSVKCPHSFSFHFLKHWTCYARLPSRAYLLTIDRRQFSLTFRHSQLQ